jgi:phenylacetate-CoA ligase
LPILTRKDLLENKNKICCSYPISHGTPTQITTSGSSGQPVEVNRTGLNQLIWLALTMREHFWHKRDFYQTLCSAKANSEVHDNIEKAQEIGWGLPVSLFYGSGPGYSLPLSTDVKRQVEWLIKRQPGYFITYPNNLKEIISHLNKNNIKIPSLLEFRTVGETVTDELRQQCHILGVRLVDCYSSQEVGLIASQCPNCDLYHIHSESLIVEVLKEDGSACDVGETGRVVITDLHNFATPLIRYDIKDYATIGPSCSCGKNLPTLSKILGRSRNMIKLPDGTRHWPIFGLHHFHEIGNILQYQVIQYTDKDIEVNLVTKEKLSLAKENQLRDIIQKAIGYRFNILFKYFEKEIPNKNGKYEEFISMI